MDDVEFLLKLAQGINPFTNEKCKDDEVLCHPNVIRNLYKLAMRLNEREYAILFNNLPEDLAHIDDEPQVKLLYQHRDKYRAIDYWNKLITPTTDLFVESPALANDYYVAEISLVELVPHYDWQKLPVDEFEERDFLIIYRKVNPRSKKPQREESLFSGELRAGFFPEDLNSEEAIAAAKEAIRLLGIKNNELYEFLRLDLTM